ncbi:hypothetical protein OIV83_004586 [Microbotryomycetes sp. JL201]|nr:hypothetical protein OIV83_004586 [Microbotryomycetes sp. JL201]
MSTHNVKSVGVVGAGQMGLGIALVAAKTAKANVIVTDNSQAQLDKASAFADKLLAKDVDKGKMSKQDADATKDRMRFASGVEAMRDVDLVVEAVSENLALKQRIFGQLSEQIQKDAILASNTSSISLSTLAAAAGARAHQVVGFHFFNPVPVMKLVELIPALQTSDDVLARARSFAEAMGKTVTVSQDTPGFVSNRLLMPFINEAIIALESGIATKEDIDTTLKLGMGHPMGPLTLADFIGLDTCLSIMEVLQRETGDSKYRPAVLLGRMVAAGWLGKKSGHGFFTY